MKGKLRPRKDTTVNPWGNESIRHVFARVDAGRHQFLKSSLSGSVAAASAGLLGFSTPAAAAPIPPKPLADGGIGFDSICPTRAPVVDEVQVPPGYKVEVLAPWDQPIMPVVPEWRPDATQDAATQAIQFGLHFFPFTGRGGRSKDRGLLCVNHEYTHEEILHGAEDLSGGAGGPASAEDAVFGAARRRADCAGAPAAAMPRPPAPVSRWAASEPTPSPRRPAWWRTSRAGCVTRPATMGGCSLARKTTMPARRPDALRPARS